MAIFRKVRLGSTDYRDLGKRALSRRLYSSSIIINKRFHYVCVYVCSRNLEMVGSLPKIYWILIWKYPGFIPFGTNLTHFGPKSGPPGLESCKWNNEAVMGNRRLLFKRKSSWITLWVLKRILKGDHLFLFKLWF